MYDNYYNHTFISVQKNHVFSCIYKPNLEFSLEDNKKDNAPDISISFFSMESGY